VTDHVQVGQPGTPIRDEALCEACGSVVDRYGGQLTVLLEDAQTTASDREVTLPRPASDASSTR